MPLATSFAHFTHCGGPGQRLDGLLPGQSSVIPTVGILPIAFEQTICAKASSPATGCLQAAAGALEHGAIAAVSIAPGAAVSTVASVAVSIVAAAVASGAAVSIVVVSTAASVMSTCIAAAAVVAVSPAVRISVVAAPTVVSLDHWCICTEAAAAPFTCI